MKPINLAAIVLFLLTNGCEYEPKGVYEVKVDPVTDTPEITVNLNFQTDTIYIPTSAYVRFDYSTSDQMVRYAYFALSQRQISKIESTSGSFSILFNSDLYQINLPYKLNIELFRSTGSGSLADRIQREGFLYSKEFTLIFKSDADMAPRIKRVVPENGSLKIIWEKFKGVGFVKYHVFNGPDYKIVISDQNQNYWYDLSFIGYGLYYIVVETDYGTYSSSWYNFDDINLLSPTASKLPDGKLLISWKKHKYYGNLAGYRIYKFIPLVGEYSEIAFITEVSDTTLVCDEGIFGIKERFYVLPVAKIRPYIINDDGDLQNYAAVTNDLILGESMTSFFNRCFLHPKGSDCYFFTGTFIYKFNCTSQSLIDSISCNYLYLTVSPDGSKLLNFNTDHIDMVDAQTMETTESIPLSSLPDGKQPVKFLISNTNIGVLTNNSGNYYFYDFQNKTELARFNINGITQSYDITKVSPDGVYFCDSHFTTGYSDYITELFERENSEVSLVWTDKVTYYDFDPDNFHFVFFKNKTLYTVSLDDLSTLSELPVEDDYLYDIDWNRREYLSLNAGRNLFSICNLETGEVKAKIKTVKFDGTSYDNEDIFLSNKTLFILGYRLKLDYPD